MAEICQIVAENIAIFMASTANVASKIANVIVTFANREARLAVLIDNIANVWANSAYVRTAIAIFAAAIATFPARFWLISKIYASKKWKTLERSSEMILAKRVFYGDFDIESW